MQEQPAPMSIPLLIAIALSTAVDVVGASSFPTPLLGIQDELRVSKSMARFGEDASMSTGTVAGRPGTMKPEELSKSDMTKTVQFAPRLDSPEGLLPGMMWHPPFPPPGLGPEGPPPRLAPRQVCLEDISYNMALYAYIKSRLQLTDDQGPAEKAVDDALESSLRKLRALCQTLPNEMVSPPGLMERADYLEKDLAARLDLLRAVKAPMQDLFSRLSSDQRARLDAPPPFLPF